jgi:small subunit ribosomal protein S16
MVKIRLRRTGTKKKASYRIVIAPSTAPRDGRFIENIGYYHPREDPEVVVVKENRLFHWLSVGAQPTDSVKRILSSHGSLERYAQFTAGTSEAEVPAPEADAPQTDTEASPPQPPAAEAPASEVVEAEDTAAETAEDETAEAVES